MKIGNLYNLESFKNFQDSSKKMGFEDSYAGVVLARNLTAVNPKIFEKKYPDLAFMATGIQADNTGGYARRIQSLRVAELGGFKQSGDASGDKGSISLTGEDSYISVIENLAKSVWTDSEIKEADLQGINLVSRYLTAHNKIYMREIDEAGLVGVAGNKGLLTYAGFNSSAAGGLIGTLTPQQMYDAYSTLIQEQKNAVNNTDEYTVKTVTTPTRCINMLEATMMDTTAGTQSVLSALQGNFPDIKFIGTFRAENAGPLNVSVTTASATSDEAMVMRIPLALQIGEIVKQGSFDFQVDSKYRVAGLDVLEDSAGRHLYGL